jgi:serine phosphatase RsbU (regulator of sigma subunit)
MQNAFTPGRTPLAAALPPLAGLDLRALYYSKRTGGDFFDATVVGRHVLFLLTDIAGNREEAHAIAAAAQDTFRLRAPQLFGVDGINIMDNLATLAHEINQSLINAADGPRFSPTFLGCFDLPLGVLAYINAGGQPAIFCDNDGTRILGHVTMPLGLFTHLTYEPAIQAFEPGARLLLVTKGILEARNGRAHFGVERAVSLLEDLAPGTAFDLCKVILEKAHNFRRKSWYSLKRLPLKKPEPVQDLTAVSLVRPF